MAYKRILTIQDISCVGQCSMTVALPILSACGHETCILPTAVLSTHTGGFGKPVVHHLSDSADAMWRHWQEQGITFDAILVGYLGSIRAIEMVSEIRKQLLAPGGICLVDPAMADHGKLYSGFNADYAAAMQALCEQADIMIPNVTEAAMMTGLPYRTEIEEAYVRDLLSRLGGKHVVLTGVGFSPEETGAAIRENGKITFHHHKRFPASFHGTGDMFAACLCGALMQDLSLDSAAGIAADFTCRAIENTCHSPAHWYGVKFETALPWLISRLHPGC